MFRIFSTTAVALAGLAALLTAVAPAGDGPLPHELQDVRSDRSVPAVTVDQEGEQR